MVVQREWIEKQEAVTIAHLAAEYHSADNRAMTHVQVLLLQCAKLAEPPLLILNMADTVCFGAEFMNVLLDCHRQIEERAGRFVLCNVNSISLEMLEITHLNWLWLICSTQNEAIRAIQQVTPVRTSIRQLNGCLEGTS